MHEVERDLVVTVRDACFTPPDGVALMSEVQFVLRQGAVVTLRRDEAAMRLSLIDAQGLVAALQEAIGLAEEMTRAGRMRLAEVVDADA